MSGYLPAAPVASVLPAVRAEPRPDGTIALLREPGQGSTSSFVIGGVAVSVAVVLFAAGVTVPATVVLLVALWQLGRGFWKAQQRSSLGDAELVLPRLPVRLGEPMTIRYAQRRTGRAAVIGLSATVSCREWVRYRQGTTTSTQTQVLWEQPLPQAIADPLGYAELVRGTWQVRLPPELPPSFSASDNAIAWRVNIHVAVQGRPDIRTDFVLPVAPEVVRDLR